MITEGTTKQYPKKISRYSMEPNAASLASIREFMRSTLSPYSHLEPLLYDIVSATHEAAQNAVVHNPEANDPVEVTCTVLDDAVSVEVRDRGNGFDVEEALPIELPDPDSIRGRGLFLIHSLMDEVETSTNSSGTMVTMLKRAPCSPLRAEEPVMRVRPRP